MNIFTSSQPEGFFMATSDEHQLIAFALGAAHPRVHAVLTQLDSPTSQSNSNPRSLRVNRPYLI